MPEDPTELITLMHAARYARLCEYASMVYGLHEIQRIGFFFLARILLTWKLKGQKVKMGQNGQYGQIRKINGLILDSKADLRTDNVLSKEKLHSDLNELQNYW